LFVASGQSASTRSSSSLIARAAREPGQDRAVVRALAVDEVVAGAGVARDLDRLVYDAQVARVVNEAVMRIDLGVDPRPEMNVRLELGRPRKELVRDGRAADAEKDEYE
jgi:hypothetical protein